MICRTTEESMPFTMLLSKAFRLEKECISKT